MVSLSVFLNETYSVAIGASLICIDVDSRRCMCCTEVAVSLVEVLVMMVPVLIQFSLYETGKRLLSSVSYASFVTLHVCVCVFQMTSPDVADSLGLSVGRYEYVERRQEISVNSSATEISPAVSTAGDSSHSLPSELETPNTLLPDGGHEDNDRIDTVLDDTNDTSGKEAVDEDVDRLMPADGMRDHLAGNIQSHYGDCTAVDAQTDIVMSGRDERVEILGNKDNTIVNAESNRMEDLDSNSYLGSDLNESTVDNGSPNEGCPMTTEEALVTEGTCNDTLRLAARSEMSMSTSDDVIWHNGETGHLNGTSLVLETPARCHTQSSEQQNSSSDTVTLLPTAEDLDGLLKVISRT